ncbi:hypothetical protein LV779_21340 [Streptomyces thinghirensis]|nr:hypothetical protein [Streptomyces thinghirensis]
MADRVIDAIRAADDTRPLVIGSDKYRRMPAKGSAADLMLAKLDGLGLNYNTAKSVDDLHAAYPHPLPLRVRVVVRDLHARHLPGTGTPQHRREPDAREAGHLILRQQPRLLDHERRVRATRRTGTGSGSPASSCGPASTTSASRRRTTSSR